MLTFSDQVAIAQSISGLTDTANTTAFKRDINTGGTRFLAVLDRAYNRQSRVADLTASQQYYQLPEDALRPSQVIVTMGTTYRPLEEVPDEFTWRLMNQTSMTGTPTHYFVRGFDEIGLYPVPSTTTTAGLELVFEPKHVQLTQDDYTTGTVTATNGSTTITHSATGFTSNMVGRYFQNTDGSDENWYRISAYSDTSNLTLENYYLGASVAGAAFRIGQVMNIPEEFHEAPVDYAMYRYFLTRGDKDQASEFRSLFEGALANAKELYGRATSNQIVRASNRLRLYNPLTDTPTIDV